MHLYFLVLMLLNYQFIKLIKEEPLNLYSIQKEVHKMMLPFQKYLKYDYIISNLH